VFFFGPHWQVLVVSSSNSLHYYRCVCVHIFSHLASVNVSRLFEATKLRSNRIWIWFRLTFFQRRLEDFIGLISVLLINNTHIPGLCSLPQGCLHSDPLSASHTHTHTHTRDGLTRINTHGNPVSHIGNYTHTHTHTHIWNRTGKPNHSVPKKTLFTISSELKNRLWPLRVCVCVCVCLCERLCVWIVSSLG